VGSSQPRPFERAWSAKGCKFRYLDGTRLNGAAGSGFQEEWFVKAAAAMFQSAVNWLMDLPSW